jgi:hypothetical protein
VIESRTGRVGVAQHAAILSGKSGWRNRSADTLTPTGTATAGIVPGAILPTGRAGPIRDGDDQAAFSAIAMN